MLVPRALNTTKNPINFCSTYLSPVPKPINKILSFPNGSFKIIYLKVYGPRPIDGLHFGQASRLFNDTIGDYAVYCYDKVLYL